MATTLEVGDVGIPREDWSIDLLDHLGGIDGLLRDVRIFWERQM
jgi:hypothetical protein